MTGTPKVGFRLSFLHLHIAFWIMSCKSHLLKLQFQQVWGGGQFLLDKQSTLLSKQMHGTQHASPSLTRIHTLSAVDCMAEACWAPSTLSCEWPGFLPYSKKPRRSIKLHLLYSAGRPPRTHVPTEPGTLLANISEGQLRVTLEPTIHHSLASP